MRYYIILILLFFQAATFAQHKIEIKSKVSQTSNSVMLRWAPSTPILWKTSNGFDAGYKLIKYKIAENGIVLNSPIKLDSVSYFVPPFTLDNTPTRLTWFQKFMADSVWNQPRSYFENNQNTSPLLIVNDQYALLWASYYAEEVTSSTLPENGIVDISSDLDKRFTTALSICDYDFDAARFVGLGHIDTNLDPNIKYFYEVKSLSSTVPSESGKVFVSLDEREDLTRIPPYEVSVAFVDSVAKINWNVSLLDNFYSSYDVYKSTNGTNFTKLNTKPLVKVGSDTDTDLTYTDSLVIVNAQNVRSLDLNQTYYYKVVGRTPFGELGRESEVVSGKVRLFLHDAPYIYDANLDFNARDNKALVKFSFPVKYNQGVNKFLISYSTTSSTTGYTYLPDIISPNSVGTYEYKVNALPINQITFFRVTAMPFHGDQQDSNPEMVEPIDSIPPLTPTIVSVIEDGRLVKDGDSLLIAKITWNIDTLLAQNTDIDGYRIFRSQNENEEPSQITNLDNIPKNVFVYRDTISYFTLPRDLSGLRSIADTSGTSSLNSKVYYKIRALDKRENQGPLSAKGFLKKPDKIPLPPVVINDYNMGDDGIGISWSPYIGTDSFYVDFDFSKLSVFRAEITQAQIAAVSHNEGSPNWSFLGDIFDPLDSSFFDIQVQKSKTYAYCIITTDLSNNRSLSKPFIIQYKPKTNVSSTEPSITAFTAVKETTKKYVQLNWTHTSQNVVEYVLFRSTTNLEELSQYKVLENTEKEFFDLDIKAGSTYKYGLMANYADGSHSLLIKAEVTF